MRNQCLKKQILFFLVFISGIIFHLQGASPFLANSLKDINAKEGKIKLTLARVWGGDDTDDENQFFRCPGDIEIDPIGRVYILDSGNHRIQVFDKSGKFIRTIGKKGQGPGDMLGPLDIAFTGNGNIMVLDAYNSRIQEFKPEGKYINSFRMGDNFIDQFFISSEDKVLLYLPKKNDEKKWGLSLMDLKGDWNKDILLLPCHDEKREINVGNNRQTIRECLKENIFYLADQKGDIYILYHRLPVYQRFSAKGQLLATVTYEVPFATFKINLPSTGTFPQLTQSENEKKQSPAAAFNVDGQGRVFLASFDRPLAQKEKFYITGPSERAPGDFPGKTDLQRLLVFDSKGKIIASKKLPVFCDRIYLHDDRLFIIDTYRLMMIYEYKYEM